jgi:hypothetical protein
MPTRSLAPTILALQDAAGTRKFQEITTPSVCCAHKAFTKTPSSCHMHLLALKLEPASITD